LLIKHKQERDSHHTWIFVNSSQYLFYLWNPCAIAVVNNKNYSIYTVEIVLPQSIGLFPATNIPQGKIEPIVIYLFYVKANCRNLSLLLKPLIF